MRSLVPAGYRTRGSEPGPGGLGAPLAELSGSSELERRRYRLGRLRRSTCDLGTEVPGPWRLPGAARTQAEESVCVMGVSLELALSLRVPGPQVVIEPPVARRRRVAHDSPHGILGPFSTFNSGDPPARASTPASFRLHRWFGLDGLLSPGPCRLVSSDSTHGVPGRAVAIASAFAASSRPVFDRSAALRSSYAPPEGDGSELNPGSPGGEAGSRIGRACHRGGRPGPRRAFRTSLPVRGPEARGQTMRDRIRA